MRPRQSLIEIFSTFVQFTGDCFSGWRMEPTLRRNMEYCLKRLPELETSENSWALYWHKLWHKQHLSLAREHLWAYLQETCYWAAEKTLVKVANTQYKISDCFQIAVARSDKVLEGFKPGRGFPLKSYASVLFKNTIVNNLRQLGVTDICTDWALLRKLSQKRLESSLQNAGLTPETVERYILAWVCFKTVYVPTHPTGTQQLPPPNPGTWKEIAQLYNSERRVQLNSGEAACSPETLEQWLRESAQWARSYLYPPVTSLNQPQPQQESGERLDYLASLDESLWTEIIVQEEEGELQTLETQVHIVMSEALTKLARDVQNSLELYYGQGLTQKQIAQQLKLKQYTVSRRLTKGRKLLLETLAKWSQEFLHISLNSNVINDMSRVLEEWLQNYYEHLS